MSRVARVVVVVVAPLAALHHGIVPGRAYVAHDVRVLQLGQQAHLALELRHRLFCSFGVVQHLHLLHREELAGVRVQAEVHGPERPGAQTVAARPPPRERRRGGQVKTAPHGVRVLAREAVASKGLARASPAMPRLERQALRGGVAAVRRVRGRGAVTSPTDGAHAHVLHRDAGDAPDGSARVLGRDAARTHARPVTFSRVS